MDDNKDGRDEHAANVKAMAGAGLPIPVRELMEGQVLQPTPVRFDPPLAFDGTDDVMGSAAVVEKGPEVLEGKVLPPGWKGEAAVPPVHEHATDALKYMMGGAGGPRATSLMLAQARIKLLEEQVGRYRASWEDEDLFHVPRPHFSMIGTWGQIWGSRGGALGAWVVGWILGGYGWDLTMAVLWTFGGFLFGMSLKEAQVRDRVLDRHEPNRARRPGKNQQ